MWLAEDDSSRDRDGGKWTYSKDISYIEGKIIALDNRLDLGEVVVVKEGGVKHGKQASILWKLMNVGAGRRL